MTLLARICTTNAWTRVSSGTLTVGHSYTLTLVSHDDNYSADPTYTLYDDVAVSGDTTPPTTSISTPANGATVSGTVTVTASATDNVGVTRIELYVDGALATSAASGSITYSWNTTLIANGSHTLVSKAYDSAGNVGTSGTVTVNVSNSSGGGAQQLLGNQGFENGSSNTAPWTTTPAVVSSDPSESAHSGIWDAWLDGYGTTHTDSISQQVTLPANITTATLTFWLHIDTAETTTTTAFDVLTVQIQNTSGAILATLGTYSNLNANSGYAQKSFNLIAYKGQTVKIVLVGAEDASKQTSFVVDDFALNVQ